MFFNKDKFIPGEDERIILNYQKGDCQHIEKLIRKYEMLVYTVCFRQLARIKGYRGAKYHAEDLAQEVWRKVFQNVRKYQPVSAFKAWLVVIARNTARDSLKKAYLKNEVFEAELVKTDEDERADTILEAFPRKLQRPNQQGQMENETMRKSLIHVLHICKNKLKPEFQSIMDMYLSETSQRDMAKKLTLSLGAVNKRIKTILGNLLNCLEKNGVSAQDILECFYEYE